MTIYFYRASVDGCFCALENIFVYKNSEEYFQQYNFLAVT